MAAGAAARPGLQGVLLGAGRPLVVAAAVVPAVLWVRRRPDRAYAAVGLALLGPLAPAFTPRELVWPAVFGYLGDARWAGIYTAVAGATLLWTSAWWGPGPPWDGGVAPELLPASGRGAALGLATWLVLVAWAGVGWRTVAVESRRPRGRDRPSAGDPPAATASEPTAATPPQALAPPGGSRACRSSTEGPASRARPAKDGPQLLRLGFLVDEVVRVMRYDPAFCRAAAPNRLGNGYVTSSFQGLGGSWLVVDWDAIRLPAALTAR
jgi:hypothetical protein